MISRIPYLDALYSRTGIYENPSENISFEIKQNGRNIILNSQGFSTRSTELIGIIGVARYSLELCLSTELPNIMKLIQKPNSEVLEKEELEIHFIEEELNFEFSLLFKDKELKIVIKLKNKTIKNYSLTKKST